MDSTCPWPLRYFKRHQEVLAKPIFRDDQEKFSVFLISVEEALLKNGILRQTLKL
jgi:hypothetical protein